MVSSIAMNLCQERSWSLDLVADRSNSPLCVEEFDLSDKNFRPCPCGYQVLLPSFLHQERRSSLSLEAASGLEMYCAKYEFLAGVPVLLQ